MHYYRYIKLYFGWNQAQQVMIDMTYCDWIEDIYLPNEEN